MSRNDSPWAGLIRRLPDGGTPLRCSGRAGVAVVLAGICYSVGAAFTLPFRASGDVVTAVPLVVLLVVLVAQGRLGPCAVAVPDHQPPRLTRAGMAVWALLVALIVALEAVTYLGAPRSAYPTASAIYDTFSHWRAFKAFAYFLWLSLGWLLVRQ